MNRLYHEKKFNFRDGPKILLPGGTPVVRGAQYRGGIPF